MCQHGEFTTGEVQFSGWHACCFPGAEPELPMLNDSHCAWILAARWRTPKESTETGIDWEACTRGPRRHPPGGDR